MNKEIEMNMLKELQELQCLKNSKSFRIGRIITWLPRKIRDYLKR